MNLVPLLDNLMPSISASYERAGYRSLAAADKKWVHDEFMKRLQSEGALAVSATNTLPNFAMAVPPVSGALATNVSFLEQPKDSCADQQGFYAVTAVSFQQCPDPDYEGYYRCKEGICDRDYNVDVGEAIGARTGVLDAATAGATAGVVWCGVGGPITLACVGTVASGYLIAVAAAEYNYQTSVSYAGIRRSNCIDDCRSKYLECGSSGPNPSLQPVV